MSILKKKSLIDVLELISGYSEIQPRIVFVNDDVQLKGNLADFKALSAEFKGDLKALEKFIDKLEEEIFTPITSIEVFNYFKKVTNDFSEEETRITLREMYVFRDMTLEEELYHLARLEYHKNNWTIPTYTKTGIFGTIEHEDVKTMRSKVFPLHGLLFYEAIGLLRSKLPEKKNIDQINKSTSRGNIADKFQPKIFAHHYVLSFIFDCHVTRKSLPLGEKTELERIGSERIGNGKGNRFYKVFNEITKEDLNKESTLIALGGINWREIVLSLSNHPEEVEKFLQSKGL